MSTVKFRIDYPQGKRKAAFCRQYGLNSIYAGKHWSKRNQDKDYWYLLVRQAMRAHDVPPVMFDKPAEIVFFWDDGLDCSNHAYMAKMIEDAMVGYIIRDDNRRHVKRIIHDFHDGGYIGVEVRHYHDHQGR